MTETPTSHIHAASSGTGAIFVTGAAGFIGSHVAERLCAQGRRVVGLDNFDPFYDPAEKHAAVARVAASSSGRFTMIEGDAVDRERIRSLLASQEFDGVIHLAAKAGVRPSIVDPAGYMRANVEATAVVLDEAHRAGLSRVVVASSSSVYGNGSRVPFSEEDAALEPISPYAASKRACELLGYSHWHLTKMPVAMLRFFTVYGPRQRPDLAIRTFMEKIRRGEVLRVFGDGSTSRDYTFIDDIVSGVLASYERIPDFGYRVWNLGGSNPVTLTELLDAIARASGVQPVIERLPMQAGDVLRTWADPTRSARELGYVPRTTLDVGLRRQWEWVTSRM